VSLEWGKKGYNEKKSRRSLVRSRKKEGRGKKWCEAVRKKIHNETPKGSGFERVRTKKPSQQFRRTPKQALKGDAWGGADCGYIWGAGKCVLEQKRGGKKKPNMERRLQALNGGKVGLFQNHKWGVLCIDKRVGGVWRHQGKKKRRGGRGSTKKKRPRLNQPPNQIPGTPGKSAKRQKKRGPGTERG